MSKYLRAAQKTAEAVDTSQRPSTMNRTAPTARGATKIIFSAEGSNLRGFTALLNPEPTVSKAQNGPTSGYPAPVYQRPHCLETEADNIAREELAKRRPESLALLPTERDIGGYYMPRPYGDSSWSGRSGSKSKALALQYLLLKKLNELDQSKITALAEEDAKYKPTVSHLRHQRVEPVRLSEVSKLIGSTVARMRTTNSLYDETADDVLSKREVPDAITADSVDEVTQDEFIAVYHEYTKALMTHRIPQTSLSEMTHDQQFSCISARETVRDRLSHYTDTRNSEVDNDSLKESNGKYPTLQQVGEMLASEWATFKAKYDTALSRTAAAVSSTPGTSSVTDLAASTTGA